MRTCRCQWLKRCGNLARCADHDGGGDAGQAIPDDAVLAFATAEQRVLITLNRKHFIRLHTTQPDHAGLVVCTFDREYATLAQRIHDALITEPVMRGRLVRVNRPA